MNTDEALLFRNNQEWRNWLEEHHDSAKEVWLVHYKKNSGKVSVSHNKAVEEALCFGWIDGKLKSLDKDSFILRYSPRKANSVWSQINKDKAEQLIYQGRVTKAGLAKVAEAKKNGFGRRLILTKGAKNYQLTWKRHYQQKMLPG